MSNARFAFSAVASLALAGSLSAQIGSLNDANVRYELLALPTSIAADAPRIRFSADPALTTIAHSFWWHYRLAGDTRESTFNDSGGQLTTSFVGSVATLEWTNADNRGIDATYVIAARSTGTTAGTLIHHMTVTNQTASPLTLDLFAYCDIDHCDTGDGDTASGTGDRHTVQDAGCPGEPAEFWAIGATAYAADAWPNILDSLVDAQQTTLTNTGVPSAAPTDYTAAMQFTSPTLAPGESFTAVAAVSHKHTFVYCGNRAAARRYGTGLAGTTGAPELDTELLPVVGSNGKLVLRGGRPNAIGTLLFGETPATATSACPASA